MLHTDDRGSIPLGSTKSYIKIRRIILKTVILLISLIVLPALALADGGGNRHEDVIGIPGDPDYGFCDVVHSGRCKGAEERR